jgi:H+/gluconate symporter-like permease
MKKALEYIQLIVAAICVIGAISTEDAVFVVAGLITAIPIAKEIKRFISKNSGGNAIE